MRTFHIRYEHGWFFHRSLVKAVRNCQSKQMKNLKLAFKMVREIKCKNFLNFHFCYDLDKITYFDINAGLKFPKRSRNLQRKRISMQFSQSF